VLYLEPKDMQGERRQISLKGAKSVESQMKWVASLLIKYMGITKAYDLTPADLNVAPSREVIPTNPKDWSLSTTSQNKVTDIWCFEILGRCYP